MSEKTDKQKAKTAIKFGENGDCTYELILLKEIAKVLIGCYGDIKEKDDQLVYDLIYHLKKVKKLLLKL